MLVVLSCDIQPIGFRKSFRIAVASPHYRDYSLTPSNELSSQIDIRGSQSRGVLTGTLVTQQLLHRRRNQGRVRAQAIQFGGMTQQSKYAIANQVCCGLQPSD